jgi:hypothetical protein
MSIKANTFETYGAKGIREDLTDAIYNISPTETPFTSMIGRTKADQTLHEWQTDSLANTNTSNAVIEGDDTDSAGYDAVSATTRMGNYMQISRKTVIISGTQEVVKKAGRKSELAYQVAKKGKELKRDIEAICLSNQGAVAGNSTTARQTGALLAFIKTNVNKAADGANPSYTTVPTGTRTDGTPRSFTETILKDVIQKTWTSGGDCSVLMVDGTQKQTVSGFSGIASTRFNVSSAKPSTIIGAADIYVSDFGNVSVVPNRFQRHSDAFLLDPSMAKLAFLRPVFTEPLAKTGDAEKRQMICEWGLQVNNEAAFGLAADLS